jgi:hypothetical protein
MLRNTKFLSYNTKIVFRVNGPSVLIVAALVRKKKHVE